MRGLSVNLSDLTVASSPYHILDLLMTDVPDLVRVAIVAPIGNSDHSSRSAVISMAPAVSHLWLAGKFS